MDITGQKSRKIGQRGRELVDCGETEGRVEN